MVVGDFVCVFRRRPDTGVSASSAPSSCDYVEIPENDSIFGDSELGEEDEFHDLRRIVSEIMPIVLPPDEEMTNKPSTSDFIVNSSWQGTCKTHMMSSTANGMISALIW